MLQRGETDVSVIYTSSIEPAAPCSRPAAVAGVDQPLFAVSARFPLGLGTFAVPRSPAGMSGQGVRPFGLRFATVIDRAAAPLPGWSYCPIRQMAVATDGSGQPFFRRFATANGTMPTTGSTPDGQGNTGNEEWTPDYAGDSST
jgi:putative ATP-grasp target RiPP